MALRRGDNLEVKGVAIQSACLGSSPLSPGKVLQNKNVIQGR